jgi:hypothetical protein
LLLPLSHEAVIFSFRLIMELAFLPILDAAKYPVLTP